MSEKPEHWHIPFRHDDDDEDENDDGRFWEMNRAMYKTEGQIFERAGWQIKQRDFYEDPPTADQLEGTQITTAVGRVPTQDLYDNNDRVFQKDGNAVPPEGHWRNRAVFEIRNGRWEVAEQQWAGSEPKVFTREQPFKRQAPIVV